MSGRRTRVIGAGDEHSTSAMLGTREAAAQQQLDGVAHGHSGYTEVCGERGLGRKPVSVLIPSLLNGRGKQVRNLLVQWTICCAVECAELFGLGSVIHSCFVVRPLTGVGSDPCGVLDWLAVSDVGAGVG